MNVASWWIRLESVDAVSEIFGQTNFQPYFEVYANGLVIRIECDEHPGVIKELEAARNELLLALNAGGSYLLGEQG